MKKVLIGLGIGCGVIILGSLIAVFAGGAYLFGKVKDSGAIEAAQAVEKQSGQMAELNKAYPFKAPADNEVLELEEARLATYLSVREAVIPAYKLHEEKGKAFQEKYGRGDGSDGKAKADLSSTMEAVNLITGLTVEVRTAFIDGLTKHKMSPNEFQAITQTVYASMAADINAQVNQGRAKAVEMMEKQIKDLDKKLENANLPAEEREGYTTMRAGLQENIDAMSGGDTGEEGALSEASKKAAAANMALLKKHGERVKGMENAALDALLLSDSGMVMPELEDTPESAD
ncbi:hypothetical protein MYSTI_00556 [Myxococcus stipitatus DSM 14675]|uniref:Uncharacterized protein n=1 Tax=Myxococcus stipitatus (strain DSM 14675 / JCM 12634 / Mx s8) TaxID=1278073 RepID=L7TZH7_MYXSD|nr:hypothetical protein [Myxococcus stipitatus]AGC41906.1 hypothetical protein MYSTI_00556 [Myxococcus stipitatus DSM 14675]